MILYSSNKAKITPPKVRLPSTSSFFKSTICVLTLCRISWISKIRSLPLLSFGYMGVFTTIVAKLFSASDNSKRWICSAALSLVMMSSRIKACKSCWVSFGNVFSTKGRNDAGKMTFFEMPLNIGAISSTL